MCPGNLENAAEEHLGCLTGMEGLHACVPRPEAHAEALHSTLAAQYSELSLPRLAKQHPSHESPALHECRQHCAVEIRVCFTPSHLTLTTFLS